MLFLDLFTSETGSIWDGKICIVDLLPPWRLYLYIIPTHHGFQSTSVVQYNLCWNGRSRFIAATSAASVRSVQVKRFKLVHDESADEFERGEAAAGGGGGKYVT